MNTTKPPSQSTSTLTGDDGEAMEKTPEKKTFKPNENLTEPADTGWFVAVVRVNCEARISHSIQKTLNQHGIWFDYWIPKIKVPYIDRRSHKRKLKEKIFLSTFIFCRVSPKHLDEIRFRSDVYKMLTMPGHREIYQIPDAELTNYRCLVENEDELVTAAPVPLKKGVKVRIIAGKLKNLEAYVQRFTAKQAIIGNEIKFLSGATITISRDYLEIVKEK